LTAGFAGAWADPECSLHEARAAVAASAAARDAIRIQPLKIAGLVSVKLLVLGVKIVERFRYPKKETAERSNLG
jgi:hypothetical protein